MKRRSSGLDTTGWLGLGLLLGSVFAPEAISEVVRIIVAGTVSAALKDAKAAPARRTDFGICVG